MSEASRCAHTAAYVLEADFTNKVNYLGLQASTTGQFRNASLEMMLGRARTQMAKVLLAYYVHQASSLSKAHLTLIEDKLYQKWWDGHDREDAPYHGRSDQRNVIQFFFRVGHHSTIVAVVINQEVDCISETVLVVYRTNGRNSTYKSPPEYIILYTFQLRSASLPNASECGTNWWVDDGQLNVWPYLFNPALIHRPMPSLKFVLIFLDKRRKLFYYRKRHGQIEM